MRHLQAREICRCRIRSSHRLVPFPSPSLHLQAGSSRSPTLLQARTCHHSSNQILLFSLSTFNCSLSLVTTSGSLARSFRPSRVAVPFAVPSVRHPVHSGLAALLSSLRIWTVPMMILFVMRTLHTNATRTATLLTTPTPSSTRARCVSFFARVLQVFLGKTQCPFLTHCVSPQNGLCRLLPPEHAGRFVKAPSPLHLMFHAASTVLVPMIACCLLGFPARITHKDFGQLLHERHIHGEVCSFLSKFAKKICQKKIRPTFVVTLPKLDTSTGLHAMMPSPFLQLSLTAITFSGHPFRIFAKRLKKDASNPKGRYNCSLLCAPVI